MKLIELLARELKEWPSDCSAGYCVQSNDDGEVFFGGTAKSVMLSASADDSETARVTRDEWAAARQILTTPTLETMLTEWRDLEARAQAAQAEADALFEHAGQCHGEIVVRLAELGWGASRMVPGSPVVTLDDMTDWRNWQVGDIVESLIAEQDVIVCGRYPITLTSPDDDGRCFEVRDGAGEIWPMHAEQLKWISRPSAQQ